jgi:hypothetical protein
MLAAAASNLDFCSSGSYGLWVCVGGWIPNLIPSDFGGVTIAGVYFAKSKDFVSDVRLRHEAIHAQQWYRYGYAFIGLFGIEARNGPLHNGFEIQAGLVEGKYYPCHGKPCDWG